jgi:putative PIN family toxin of toxin-antitoxin system
VVLDTNVLLRALANPGSPSGKLVLACESRRAVALLSQPLWSEYQKVLVRAAEQSDKFSPEALQLMLRKLCYLGEFTGAVRARFALPRDPSDAKLIELAIELKATNIATYDADLLYLPQSRGFVKDFMRCG